MQRPPEEPANAPSASAGGAGEAAGEGEPPSSPSTPEPEPFVLRVHLTRLFGTDLTLIPGIGESTALTLFAEIGADMSRFPDAAHLASWLNLCPQNKITGGRVISSKTGPASNRAAQALRMATQSLYRSQTSLGDYFRRKRARLGTPQAITASAHKMARIIYHLVTHHVLYDDDVYTTCATGPPCRRFSYTRSRLSRRISNALAAPSVAGQQRGVDHHQGQEDQAGSPVRWPRPRTRPSPPSPPGRSAAPATSGRRRGGA